MYYSIAMIAFGIPQPKGLATATGVLVGFFGVLQLGLNYKVRYYLNNDIILIYFIFIIIIIIISILTILTKKKSSSHN